MQNADAIIAVSGGMRDDVLDCYPFIDPLQDSWSTTASTPRSTTEKATNALEEHGVDPAKPYVLFVGRITRQKGISHLLRAARMFDEDIPLVLCAASRTLLSLGGSCRRSCRAETHTPRRPLD